jgi:hypothetical protein
VDGVAGVAGVFTFNVMNNKRKISSQLLIKVRKGSTPSPPNRWHRSTTEGGDCAVCKTTHFLFCFRATRRGAAESVGRSRTLAY